VAPRGENCIGGTIAVEHTETCCAPTFQRCALKCVVDFFVQERTSNNQREKALTLWLNSTLGLLILHANREETEGAWVDFKKPTLFALPVLDLRALSAEQLKQLAAAYDRVAEKELQPIPQMATDAVRAEIDASIARALHLPDFAVLREMLAKEPVAGMRRL